MNIAIDVRHLTIENPSGIGHYTIHLIRELASLMPEVKFFLFATGTKKTLQHLPHFSNKNIFIVKRQIPNKLFKFFLVLPFGPKMESFLPEQIDAWIFPDSNIIRTKKPFIITAHDVSFEIYPEFFTSKQRNRHNVAKTKQLLKNATAILCVSEQTIRDLWQYYEIPSQNCFLTPLAAEKQFSPQVLPSDRSHLQRYRLPKKYLLSLSTQEPRKNIASIIEGYTMWRQENEMQTIPLVIAGGSGWKSTHIRKIAQQSPFSDDIYFTGYIDEAHKAVLFRHAHVTIFPSFYEGFGLPCIESMRSGTPVITSHTGSLPEVVKQYALTVNPYNSREIAQALCILEDEKTHEALSRRGMTHAKSFTWQETAQKTQEAIMTIQRHK